MTQEWAPSFWGRKLTRSPNWRLSLDDLELSLRLDGRIHAIHVQNEMAYRVNSGVLWTDITFYPGQELETKVDGLSNVNGAALTQALKAALAEHRVRREVTFLQVEYQLIDQWIKHKTDTEQSAIQERRWLTAEMQQAVIAARPLIDAKDIRTRLGDPVVAARLGARAKDLKQALLLFEMDPQPMWDALNAAHTERELKDCKDVLSRVESKPLTEDQARAVICFDNRVQVVASAGSGKTSTMIAKAAYAIHRGFVAPERIVLLAFNKQAAQELKARAAKSFERLGMTGVTVEASTFHALGLSIIGKATGEKPDIPDWATDTAGGLRMLTQIIDRLKSSSPVFRGQWDLFRFVFGKDLPALGSQGAVDTWDAQGKAFLRTAQGELVKSQEGICSPPGAAKDCLQFYSR